MNWIVAAHSFLIRLSDLSVELTGLELTRTQLGYEHTRLDQASELSHSRCLSCLRPEYISQGLFWNVIVVVQCEILTSEIWIETTVVLFLHWIVATHLCVFPLLSVTIPMRTFKTSTGTTLCTMDFQKPCVDIWATSSRRLSIDIVGGFHTSATKSMTLHTSLQVDDCSRLARRSIT